MNLIKWTGVFCLCIIWAGLLKAQDADPIPLRVVLNAADKGEHIVMMTEQGDILVPSDVLKSMGLQNVPDIGIDVEGEPHTSLREMGPGVKFSVDMENLILVINSDPRLLGNQIRDLSSDSEVVRPDTSHNSAYLNFSLNYNLGRDNEFRSLNLPWEMVTRIGPTLLQSGFTYTYSTSSDQVIEDHVRLLSNLSWDFQEATTSLVVGDYTTNSGQLGGGGTFGGLRFFRDFGLNPKIKSQPLLTLTGVIQTPSEVSIYVDNSLIRTEQLSPGAFEFQNIPNTIGTGRVVIVIKDAFGREERIETTYATASSLLKPGLHDFNYSLGVRRKNLGQDSNDYGAPAFLMSHRVGVTSHLTMGIRGEAGYNATLNLEPGLEVQVDKKEVANYGASATVSLGVAGVVNIGMAYSKERDVQEQSDVEVLERTGHAEFLNYGFSFWKFSISLSGQTQSRQYAHLSLLADADKPEFSGAGSIGLSLGTFGTLSYTHTRTDPYEGDERITQSAGLAISLGDVGSLNMRASQTTLIDNQGDETTSEGASIGISLRFGGLHSSLSQQKQPGVTTRSASVQSNSVSGTGFGYRLLASETIPDEMDRSTRQTAYVEYLGNHGLYSTTFSKAGEEKSTTFNIAGGISLVDGSVHLSRPITDAFALVRVGRLSNVGVNSHNRDAGKTDSEGEILLSDLLAYSKNSIGLSENDIPMEYILKETSTKVVPASRGGVVVEFSLTKLQAFTGFMFFKKDQPAELSLMNVTIGEIQEEVLLGRGGEFYMENIPSGTYPARIFNKEAECLFNLTIPESQEILVDLGEVYCEKR